MGNASLALELYARAEEMYGKALELKRDLSSAHIGLICTYLARGNSYKQSSRMNASVPIRTKIVTS